MSTMIRRAIIVATATATLGLALTGCAASSPRTTPNEQTYTKTSLAKDLTDAGRALGLKGGILDDAKTRTEFSGGSTSELEILTTVGNQTLTPSSCSEPLAAIGSFESAYPAGTAIGAMFITPGDIAIGVYSANDHRLASSGERDVTEVSAAIAACPAATFHLKAGSLTNSTRVALTSRTLHTDATTLAAYESSITIGTGPYTSPDTGVRVDAASGNLVVEIIAPKSTSSATLTRILDTVLRAADADPKNTAPLTLHPVRTSSA